PFQIISKSSAGVVSGERPRMRAPDSRYPKTSTTYFCRPLAASMFKVGAPMVQIVGVLFLAKMYGVILTPWQLATITLMAVATSLTAPGIPLGGGIIVMAPVLSA